MDVADFSNMIEAEENPYDRGKFKIYDVSDPSRPSLLHYQKTGGKGVHRFDMDDRYAYISTEMDGYRVNILVNYDISDPTSPKKYRVGGCRVSILPVVKTVLGRQAEQAAPCPQVRRQAVGRGLTCRVAGD